MASVGCENIGLMMQILRAGHKLDASAEVEQNQLRKEDFICGGGGGREIYSQHVLLLLRGRFHLEVFPRQLLSEYAQLLLILVMRKYVYFYMVMCLD